jgi:hypothetical protein
MHSPSQRIITSVALASLCLAAIGQQPLHGQQSDSTAIRLATESSTAWLRLVDEGKYDASWDSAAAPFQQAVTKAAWSQALTQARGPFEPFGTRTVIGTRYLETLPNAPPGPYVVIQYRAQVSGSREVIETVVPARTGQGRWLVSGYFVKPAP